MVFVIKAQVHATALIAGTHCHSTIGSTISTMMCRR